MSDYQPGCNGELPVADVKLTNDVKRYTQPCVQTLPGVAFKVAEVELFEDPNGKWVRWEDYDRLDKKCAALAFLQYGKPDQNPAAYDCCDEHQTVFPHGGVCPECKPRASGPEPQSPQLPKGFTTYVEAALGADASRYRPAVEPGADLLQIARGALADIASSTDMTKSQLQAKANRIYWDTASPEERDDENRGGDRG